MVENPPDKEEFLKGFDKIIHIFKTDTKDLEEDDFIYVRTKLKEIVKEIDKIYKEKYSKTKTEIAKNLLSTLKNKIPEKKAVKKSIKKLGKIRIVIKED